MKSMAEKIRELTALAKAAGREVMVSDVRYITAGIPTEIEEDFVYFAECVDIVETGKLGGKPTLVEKGGPGGKLVTIASIISVEMVKL